MKKIAILGSTGSIGTQTLDVVRANGDIEVLGISAGRNVKMLEEQAREFHPQLIAVWDENAAKDLAVRLADMDVKIVSGMEGLLELARMPQTDILVTAVVGMIGIRPTMEGIKAGKDIALANKETLVTAGHLIIPMAKEHGVQILPVDSEHSAIFQALHGEKQAQVEKLLITASGGPFRGRKREELEHVTLADTLKHPNWVMGQKITVDSATLVNKGLEVMEARWLFDVDLDHIQVVVQPKSIIHSMVEFKDGAVMAQLGTRICGCQSIPHSNIRNADIGMESDWISIDGKRLLLKIRIWTHSWGFQWLWMLQEKEAVCLLCLTQQMSWL